METKHFSHFLCCLLAITVSVGFISCSPDDDEYSADNIISKLKANVWYYSSNPQFNEWGDDEYSIDRSSNKLYFLTDKNGVQYWVDHSDDSYFGRSHSSGYRLFEYIVTGNEVNIYYDDDDYYVQTLYFNNDYLTDRMKVEDSSDFYKPTRMTSEDREFANSLGPQTYEDYNGLIIYTYDDRKKVLTVSQMGGAEWSDYKNYNDVPWRSLDVEKVIVEEGIKNIANLAFCDMDIKEVKLPKSLERIGIRSFEGTGLTSVDIPANVKTIATDAFHNSNELKDISFAKNSKLTKVQINAFGGCKLSGTLELPDNLEVIEALAFLGNYETVRLGANINSIGSLNFVPKYYMISRYNNYYSGNLYISNPTPPSAKADAFGGENYLKCWTLYVPVGAKANYESKEPWSKFKEIKEYNF